MPLFGSTFFESPTKLNTPKKGLINIRNMLSMVSRKTFKSS